MTLADLDVLSQIKVIWIFSDTSYFWFQNLIASVESFQSIIIKSFFIKYISSYKVWKLQYRRDSITQDVRLMAENCSWILFRITSWITFVMINVIGDCFPSWDTWLFRKDKINVCQLCWWATTREKERDLFIYRSNRYIMFEWHIVIHGRVF